MSQWIDEKYLRFLSPQLRNFKQKRSRFPLFNFSCPICGDSEKMKSKARMYVYPGKDGLSLIAKCHNCSLSLPFAALLKRLDQQLYQEYQMEMFQEQGQGHHRRDLLSEPEKTIIVKENVVASHHEVMMLPDVPKSLYAVKDFVAKRGIPEDRWETLGATEQAQTWLSKLVEPEKAARVSDGIPYLIIPLAEEDGTWYGAQLRSLTEKVYITFRWMTELKVFGLDRWTPEHPTYITEGPLDSLFLDNALAACGGDLLNVVDQCRGRGAEGWILIWDNEPRNKDVKKQMRNAIKRGEQLLIWPVGLPQKDINEMVQAGVDIEHLIAARVFSGMYAELEMKVWER